MTIMAALTLSLYRIQGTKANFGLFVTFSTLNSIYTCEYWYHPFYYLSSNSNTTLSDMGLADGFLSPPTRRPTKVLA